MFGFQRFGWGDPPTRFLAHPWEKQTRNRACVLSHIVNPFNDNNITDSRSQKMIKHLAETFRVIVNNRGLYGALRDNEALAYWQGAATALVFSGHGDIADDVAKIGAKEIAPRGFQAIMEICNV